MTVLKAIAMADGAQPTAALSRAIIVRHSSSDTDRQEIPLDLKKIITAKETDQVLESDDILFVPQSALKAGFIVGRHCRGSCGRNARIRPGSANLSLVSVTCSPRLLGRREFPRKRKHDMQTTNIAAAMNSNVISADPAAAVPLLI